MNVRSAYALNADRKLLRNGGVDFRNSDVNELDRCNGGHGGSGRLVTPARRE
jgi:hypothetical protein